MAAEGASEARVAAEGASEARVAAEGASGAGQPKGEEPEPTARLFVAVWPPGDVVAAIRALPRPELAGVRWSTSDQWHVTLAFLGEVAEASIPRLCDALQHAAATISGPVGAVLGPQTARYGRAVLGAPVAGLDGLAVAVRHAVASDGAGGRDDHPFQGHLTLARGRRGRPVPARLVGVRLTAHWEAHEVCLVRSVLDPRGARYETVGRAGLPP